MQTTQNRIGLGIIGCGKISQAYFDGAKIFKILDIVACADINPVCAQAKAQENGCQAMSVDELLAHPGIDLVINLTIPAAHAQISMAALNAGKHIYCEKPLTIALDEAQAVLALAEEKGLRVGCAPDTFLGSGLQTCRKLVDDGVIGQVVSGSAFMMCRGPESWHPNPAFFYQRGGGPVFDMAPYYLTALIHLIGPIRRVCAVTSKAFEDRIATCKERNGEILPVEVQTHCSATLEFHSGAVITAVFSFDVHKHGHAPIELYGTEGSLRVPDPNTFGGPVELYLPGKKKADWKDQKTTHTFAGSMRGIGAADMAYAILGNRPHRASGSQAYHVLEVMHAFDQSSSSGQHVSIQSMPAQPQPLPLGLKPGLLDT